jgi:hypothetical protein
LVSVSQLIKVLAQSLRGHFPENFLIQWEGNPCQPLFLFFLGSCLRPVQFALVLGPLRRWVFPWRCICPVCSWICYVFGFDDVAREGIPWNGDAIREEIFPLWASGRKWTNKACWLGFLLIFPLMLGIGAMWQLII